MKVSLYLLTFAIIADFSLFFGLVIFFVPEMALLRNHVGDVLATTFLFSVLALITKRTSHIIITTLGVTFGIELIQALNLIEQRTAVSDLLLGHQFDPIDLAIYAVTTIALARLHVYLVQKTSL